MSFVVSIGIPSLSAFGDSQVIINRVNYVARLTLVDLEHWCNHIIDIKSSFRSISFQHIYREQNSSANGLSKEALSLYMGKLAFIEYFEGEVIGNGNLRLF